MSVEQILLRSMYYFRGIFQRNNYCRRSKMSYTFGMFGAYISAKQLSAEQLTPEQMSPEHLSPEQLSAEQLSAEQMSAEQMSSEQLSPEQMSAEQISPEQMSRSICRGAFVAFFGAFVGGAYVAGAYVVSPTTHLKYHEIMTSMCLNSTILYTLVNNLYRAICCILKHHLLCNTRKLW